MSQAINQKITQKLFFQKFKISIKMNFDSGGNYFESEKYYHFLKLYLEKVLKVEFRTSTTYRHVIVYLNDMEAYKHIVDLLSPYVTEVYLPINEQHEQMLERDEMTVTIRDQLFYNKYRYSAALKDKKHRMSPSERKALIEQFGPRGDKWSYHFNAGFKAYFESVDDLIMFKLTYSAKTIKVVTKEEFEQGVA